MIATVKAIRRDWIGGLVILAALLAPSTATAASPAPSWDVSVVSYPTNFVPKSVNTTEAGPGYQIMATNVGAERTTGSFTITATLPVGVTVAPGKEPSGFFGRRNITTKLTCEVVGQLVTCTGAAPGVAPGEVAGVKIPVKLAASLTGSVVSEVTAAGGGAPAASGSTETTISDTPASFDFLPGSAGLGGLLFDEEGGVVTQAGGHPFLQKINLGFTSIPPEAGKGAPLPSGGGIRDVSATLPAGMVVNPGATPKCREFELESPDLGCPPKSQVGVVRITVGINAIGPTAQPLFNMVAPHGVPGEFGLEILEGTYVHLLGRLNSEGNYELSADATDILAKIGVMGVQALLWGDPSDESHDAQRVPCFYEHIEAVSNCPVERTNTAFVSLPSACSGPLTTHAEMDSWLEPGIFKHASFETTDLKGNPVGVKGCEDLDFEPTISLKPEVSSADSPTGLAVNLHIPQNEEYEDELTGEPKLAGSTLKDARVALPAGMTVNPSSADGLEACTAAQIGLKTPVGEPSARFTGAPPSCPDGSKIGTVEVLTPLLTDEPEKGVQVPHPVPGSIYLAQPYENPFGTLLAAYVAVNDPATGIVVKLPGKVEADPVSGQLTSTFSENPQIPFEDFKLSFFGGPRAALRSPVLCGTYASQSQLTPWSGTAPVSSSDPFQVSTGANGAPCATSLAQLPNKPSFEAGTTSPLAGRFSPFVLRLKREDGSQEFSALNITMPPGLTGKLAGTPYCPEAALAAAAAKTGREEQASPSCPAASEVGRVVVGAGSGPTPYFTEGRAYLTGPYKGDPLGIAIITPAVAGPFDLGTVVVRAALHVDLFSAQITVKSDPLPTILKGIPLDVRSIAVEVGKPEFTLNPTSCEPMNISGEAISITGQAAPLQSHFQVGGCKELGFKPKLQIALKGATHRRAHPKLIATLTPRPGDANVAFAQVTLPRAAFLDNAHIGTICTRPNFADETCPASSVYGRAEARTPLLDYPLSGSVYLIPSTHELPDLAVSFRGPAGQPIRFVLTGRTDTAKGALRNTFETAPDVPVSMFRLALFGGKRGLIQLSTGLCSRPQARIRLRGHNGLEDSTTPKVKAQCPKRAKHRGAGSSGGP